jgi:ABC-type nickel/cobalt efflux system permease component RcnA
MGLSQIYSELSLTVAFLLGVAHAFSPGHGKAVLAAYLVGSRGRVVDAIWLGLVVTIAHTFSVIILGVVIKMAYSAIMDAVVQQQTAPDAGPIPVPGAKIIQLIAGVLILGVGIWLIIGRRRIAGHSHYNPNGGGRQGIWQLLVMGISGGMVPCAEGIALLLVAIAAGQTGRGLTLVVAFSSGIALVIVTIGIMICILASLAERLLQKTGKWVAKLPVISGILISVLGCYSIARVLITLC